MKSQSSSKCCLSFSLSVKYLMMLRLFIQEEVLLRTVDWNIMNCSFKHYLFFFLILQITSVYFLQSKSRYPWTIRPARTSLRLNESSMMIRRLYQRALLPFRCTVSFHSPHHAFFFGTRTIFEFYCRYYLAMLWYTLQSTKKDWPNEKKNKCSAWKGKGSPKKELKWGLAKFSSFSLHEFFHIA